MVAVSTDERSVGEGPERRTLVLTLLIGKKCRIVDASIVSFLVELSDCKCSLRSISKSVIHEKKVIYAPYSPYPSTSQPVSGWPPLRPAAGDKLALLPAPVDE